MSKIAPVDGSPRTTCPRLRWPLYFISLPLLVMLLPLCSLLWMLVSLLRLAISVSKRAHLELMNPLDAIWLQQSKKNVTNIVAVCFVNGPLSLEVVHQLINERWVHARDGDRIRFTRFTQSTHADCCGGVYWEDVQATFCLEDHIGAVDGILTEAAVMNHAAALQSAELPPQRPLWRVEVASSVAGQTALIFCVHHSLGDGQTWVGPLVRCFSIESFDGVSKHEFAWHRVHP